MIARSTSGIGRDEMKNGIVRDADVQANVYDDIAEFLAARRRRAGWLEYRARNERTLLRLLTDWKDWRSPSARRQVRDHCRAAIAEQPPTAAVISPSSTSDLGVTILG